jgi:uncharacterized membrane protein YjjB (DUF3815 family)
MVPMNLAPVIVNALWTGLFACMLGVLLTAPRRNLAATFLCGSAGRLARDVLVGAGMSLSWATVVAAALIVLLGVTIARSHRVSPVVLISSALPLGASAAVFHTTVGLMRIPALRGEELSRATVALSSNMATAFTITLAIAMGLTIGIALVRVARRSSVWMES